MSEKDYKELIDFKKHEFNVNGWNALDINAGRLVKDGEGTLQEAITAMRECMLEGDSFLDEKQDESFTVRYYCDNLSASRGKYQG